MLKIKLEYFLAFIISTLIEFETDAATALSTYRKKIGAEFYEKSLHTYT